MTKVLEEPFSLDMLSRSKHRSKYFKDDGMHGSHASRRLQADSVKPGTFAHFTTHPEPTYALQSLLLNFSQIADDEKEVEAVVNFLKRCLKSQLEDRASAKELADDPWLVLF